MAILSAIRATPYLYIPEYISDAWSFIFASVTEEEPIRIISGSAAVDLSIRAQLRVSFGTYARGIASVP